MFTPKGKGPDGIWKTGQRVPQSGMWKDQHNDITFFGQGRTFPPSIVQKDCAYRELVSKQSRNKAK